MLAFHSYRFFVFTAVLPAVIKDVSRGQGKATNFLGRDISVLICKSQFLTSSGGAR